MNEFTNPYHVDKPYFDGPNKNLTRAPASLGVADHLFLKSIRPQNGTINTTQNILFFKLCEALRAVGITDLSKQKDFEEFVGSVVITDGRKKKKGTK